VAVEHETGEGEGEKVQMAGEVIGINMTPTRVLVEGRQVVVAIGVVEEVLMQMIEVEEGDVGQLKEVGADLRHFEVIPINKEVLLLMVVSTVEVPGRTGGGARGGEWGPDSEFSREKGPPSGNWPEGGRGRGRMGDGRGHPPPYDRGHHVDRPMPPGNRMRGPPPFPPRPVEDGFKGVGRGVFPGFPGRGMERQEARELLTERIQRVAVRQVRAQLETVFVSPKLAGNILLAEYQKNLKGTETTPTL